MAKRSLMEEISLKGKSAIVSGGSLGIGKGIALRLAEAGASVLITGRRLEHLQKAVEEITSAGGMAEYIQADAGIAADGVRVVDRAVSAFGRLDILVNNAAAVVEGPAMDFTEEMWDELMNVDLRGVFFYTQAAARKMIEQGEGGRIINVISIDAFTISANMPIYSAAKSGAEMLTRGLAKELAQHNILVNSLAPGSTRTEGAMERIGRIAKGDPESLLNKTIPVMVPLGRIGTPDDLAKAALFLSCGLSDYITGTSIVVDGARLTGPPDLKKLFSMAGRP